MTTTPPSAPDLRSRLAAVCRELVATDGPTFGYPASPALQADTWPRAFTAMTESLLDDADTWSIPVPADRVRAAWLRHEAALAEVTLPRLVHTDLWPGNVFVDPQTLRITGIIDTERSFWGDPLFELAGSDQIGTGPAPRALVDGYSADRVPARLAHLTRLLDTALDTLLT